MTQPHEMRAGNADRDAVIAALQQAGADGRLDDAELMTRIDAVRMARTFGELDEAVADLPMTPPSARFSQELAPAEPSSDIPGTWAVPVEPVGSSFENPLVIDAGWSTEKRTGPWLMPPFVRIHGGAGSVILDCTEAATSEQIIHIWVSGDIGGIAMIVPEGWAADADAVRKSLGSVSVKVPKEPTMGRPLLVINGAMGMGSLLVRSPNWFERRRMRKKLR